MSNKNNQNFVDATTETVDNLREFMQSSLASLEKISKFQIDSSKKILDETTQAVKEISSTANFNDFVNKFSKFAGESVQNNVTNCRDLYELITETQNNLSKLIEANVHASKKNLNNVMKDMPNANIPDSMKNWVANASQAFANVQKMAEEFNASAKNNFSAAVNKATAKNTTHKK
ncbi:MAG: phasin family protein [Burkholderiales bacterium]|nr:phasin family protein [Burkholderiales bacterium]